MAWMARYEWIIIEVLVLGLLLWQLVSIRRAIRADREKQRRDTTPP
jgi:hypothetical protein